jgi:ribosomal protein L7/L12
MNKLQAIEQITDICNTVSMKAKGAEICKVLFNQYIFDEFCQYPDLPSSAVEALHDSEKLQAIKIYRDQTGLPLIECKRAVENYMMLTYGYDRFPK